MTDPALTLAVAALIILFIAATALAGYLYLLVTERGPDPEPPAWVNHGATRPRCDRPRRGGWREDCRS